MLVPLLGTSWIAEESAPPILALPPVTNLPVAIDEEYVTAFLQEDAVIIFAPVTDTSVRPVVVEECVIAFPIEDENNPPVLFSADNFAYVTDIAIEHLPIPSPTPPPPPPFTSAFVQEPLPRGGGRWVNEDPCANPELLKRIALRTWCLLLVNLRRDAATVEVKNLETSIVVESLEAATTHTSVETGVNVGQHDIAGSTSLLDSSVDVSELDVTIVKPDTDD